MDRGVRAPRAAPSRRGARADRGGRGVRCRVRLRRVARRGPARRRAAAEWEGEDIAVVGVVDDLPAVATAARASRSPSSASSRRARSCRRGSRSRGTAQPRCAPDADAPPAIRAGERWRLTVRLKRPHGNVNPGGFDLEAWLLQHGLARDRLRARTRRRTRASTRSPDARRDHVQRARERVRDRIERALRGAPYAGVIVALAIGDQRAIPEPQWTVFNRTGIAHLVSISGLHVTVFAAFAGAARVRARASQRAADVARCRRAAGGGRRACWPRRRTCCSPARRFPRCGRSRWSRSRPRGLVARRGRAPPRSSGCGRSPAVLLWDPWAPLTPGFWLSYGAVALLLYASVGRLRDAAPPASWSRARRHRARGRARAMGGHDRPGAADAGAVPAGVAGLAARQRGRDSGRHARRRAARARGHRRCRSTRCFAVGARRAGAADALLEGLAALPDATWQQHAPPAWTRGRRRRRHAVAAGAARRAGTRAGASLWLAAAVRRDAAAAAGRRVPDDRARRRAGARGRRARRAGTRCVYDTGPRLHGDADAGGRIVAPFLRASGLRRADGLVVSHQDLDHAGGARSLLQAMPVGWLASSLPADHAVVAARARRADAIVRRRTGMDVGRRALHDAASDGRRLRRRVRARPTTARAWSASIRAHGSALLAGDIEAQSPRPRCCARGRDRLRADVLVVPHHGSRTSSTLGVRARGRARAAPSSAAGTATASAIRVPTSSRATRRSAPASCARISKARSR